MSLRLLFASLERQTTRDFELIVADDGSSDDTEELCNQSPLRPRFITQEDKGYRKARILNEAIHSAASDYLIFLDADVIVERHFVEDHLRLRSAGAFVCGRRVDLGPEFSRKLSLSDILAGKLDGISIRLIRSALDKDTLNIKRALRIPSERLRAAMGYRKPIDILGSNFSAWKRDLIEINGFNEALESYWGEDGDLFIRLRNSRKRAIGAKGLCVQFHVFHPRRAPTQENVEKVSALLGNLEYRRAEKGYDARF
ncbi:MAG: hypothetical protein A2X94_04370 [Bdellovibrionales bacterium GWB1_55_8]|nr:MAG: hypothetical protein A2X94_04370 [Bdellovibrionales bacterium GWB1_55_8]